MPKHAIQGNAKQEQGFFKLVYQVEEKKKKTSPLTIKSI